MFQGSWANRPDQQDLAQAIRSASLTCCVTSSTPSTAVTLISPRAWAVSARRKALAIAPGRGRGRTAPPSSARAVRSRRDAYDADREQRPDRPETSAAHSRQLSAKRRIVAFRGIPSGAALHQHARLAAGAACRPSFAAARLPILPAPATQNANLVRKLWGRRREAGYWLNSMTATRWRPARRNPGICSDRLVGALHRR